MTPNTQEVAHQITELVRVLVVSRDSAVVAPLWTVSESKRWQIESATNGWGAMERVQSGTAPDVLVLDIPRGDKDSLHFLRWLRRLRPELPVLLVSDREDSAAREEALRLGARGFITKPLQADSLENAIRQQLARAATVGAQDISCDDIAQMTGEASFVAGSPVMRNLRAQVELLAETDSPVLILGEAATGKETIAQLMHQLSVRSGFHFAKVDCAALPNDLLEIELFGCERNGNGSTSTKAGKLELCHKGTLLVDQIAEMSVDLQGKLLEVIHNKTFARPGSGVAVAADVRILAASRSSLESAIFDNKLRDDLRYRLSGYTVRVPPLRERREELPLLLHYFMRSMARQYALSPRAFSPAVVEACQSHAWPGNFRELENFVKRFLLAASTQASFVPEGFAGMDGPGGRSSSGTPVNHEKATTGGGESLKSLVQSVKLEAEKNAIAAALQTTGWNRKAAARLLKVSYRTLLYKIDQYQMKASASPVVGTAALDTNCNEVGGAGRAH